MQDSSGIIMEDNTNIRDAFRGERRTQIKKPNYKIAFETDELAHQASSDFAKNHSPQSFWENLKAEIIVSGLIIIAIIVILVYSVNYIKKRKSSIARYASGSHTTSSFSNTNSENSTVVVGSPVQSSNGNNQSSIINITNTNTNIENQEDRAHIFSSGSMSKRSDKNLEQVICHGQSPYNKRIIEKYDI